MDRLPLSSARTGGFGQRVWVTTLSSGLTCAGTLLAGPVK